MAIGIGAALATAGTAILNGIVTFADWFWNRATLKMKLVIIGGVALSLILGYILFLRAENRSQEEQLRRLEKQYSHAIIEGDLKLAGEISKRIKALKKEREELKANVNAADDERRKADEEANRAEQVNANFAADPNVDTLSDSEIDSKFCARYPAHEVCQ